MYNSNYSLNNSDVKAKSIDLSSHSYSNFGNQLTQRNTSSNSQINTTFSNSTSFSSNNMSIANDLLKLKEELLVQLVKAQDLYSIKNEISNSNMMILSKMNSFHEDMSILRTSINNDLPRHITSILNSQQQNTMTSCSLADEYKCPESFMTINYSDVVEAMNSKIIPHIIALTFHEDNKLSKVM